MRLAIADPPYPPQKGQKWDEPRASRWYGTRNRTGEGSADVHADVTEWDHPARHRALLEQLLDEYDGWAIATAADGLEAYAPLPRGVRIGAWFKPSSQPGAHRIGSAWEPVILFPPRGRRSNRDGAGMVRDAIIANPPRNGFVGAKPIEWTRWVLDCMSYNPDTDTVTDMFPGSGAVAHGIAQGVLL